MSDWIDINFEDVREGDLIRSSTSPVSQQHLGHPEADRNVEGIVTHLGDSMVTTMIRNGDGEEIVLAYDNLGSRVFINLKKYTTVTHRQIMNRETGKRGIKRKHEFGKLKLSSINKDIKFLQ
jgi:hypothetical protein